MHIIDVNPSSEPAGFVEYRYVIMNVYYRSIYVYIYYFRDETDQTNPESNEVITMRTNTNEINIHLLLSNDINRLREAG